MNKPHPILHSIAINVHHPRSLSEKTRASLLHVMALCRHPEHHLISEPHHSMSQRPIPQCCMPDQWALLFTPHPIHLHALDDLPLDFFLDNLAMGTFFYHQGDLHHCYTITKGVSGRLLSLRADC